MYYVRKSFRVKVFGVLYYHRKNFITGILILVRYNCLFYTSYAEDEIENNSKSRLVSKPGMSPRRVGVANSDKGKSLEDLVIEDRDT